MPEQPQPRADVRFDNYYRGYTINPTGEGTVAIAKQGEWIADAADHAAARVIIDDWMYAR